MHCTAQIKQKMAAITMLLSLMAVAVAHDAKDFDDSVLYKIDFEVPDLLGEPVSWSINFLLYY